MQVNFYVLKQTDLQAKFQFACRLLEKAYQKNKSVYIHLDSEASANELDSLLWTFKDDSFIPHAFDDNNIQLGFQNAPARSHDILLNLAHDIPDFFQNYPKIMEVVINEATAKQQSREHFRFYQQHTQDIHSHKL